MNRKVSFNVSLSETLDVEPFIPEILSVYRKHLKTMKENWELKSVGISYNKKTQRITINYTVDSDGSWVDLIDRQVCNAGGVEKLKVREYTIIPENLKF